MSDGIKAVGAIIIIGAVIALGVWGFRFRYLSCIEEGFGHNYCIAFSVHR